MNLVQILKALERLDPASPKCLPLKQAGEFAMMDLLKQGLRAFERWVAALAGRHRFELVQKGAGSRTWREDLDGRRRVELYAVRTGDSRMASLRYEKIPEKPKLTPAQQRRDAQQRLFYDRYMAIGQRAYRGGRITALERTLLLVGELEADVNNGGFSQYLDNKARRRAQAAVKALEAIRARKTAGMLRDALAGKNLDALDARFYAAPEDLAFLAARLLKGPGARSARATRAARA